MLDCPALKKRRLVPYSLPCAAICSAVLQDLVLQRHFIADRSPWPPTLSGLVRFDRERSSVGVRPDFMGPALLSVAEVLGHVYLL